MRNGLRYLVVLLLGSLAFADLADGQARVRPPAARIANGLPTQDYPAVGTLLSVDDDGVYTNCTATLIGCRTVLVAAHCFCEDTPAIDCLRSGLAEYVRETTAFALQHAGAFGIERVAIHPDFDFPEADVAVLELADPVSGIAPARINTEHAVPQGTRGEIVGFGFAAGRSGGGVKRRGTITTGECSGEVEGVDGLLCWNFATPPGPPGDDSDTCPGDSGGPLFADLGSGTRVIGVTSGGQLDDCGGDDVAFDTDVYAFRDWIAEQAGDDLHRAACGPLTQVGEPGSRTLAFSGELSPLDQADTYPFDVPAGTKVLRVMLNGVNDPPELPNTFDLVVEQIMVPGGTGARCHDGTDGAYGFCELQDPPEGVWSATAQWVAGAGPYQLTVTMLRETAPCAGDCDGDGHVTIDELVVGVRIALGLEQTAACPSFDPEGTGQPTVEDLVKAVAAALNGCG